MAEGSSNTDDGIKNEREEVFSKSVRAGKRTYFFDVKTTRRNDYYLTLTESKKRFNRDGRFYFEKHKIFLYKEDFEKFTDGLAEAIAYIKQHAPEILEHEARPEIPPAPKAEKDPEVQEAVADEVQEQHESTPAEEDAKSVDLNKEEVTESIAEESFTNVEFEDLEDSKS